MEQIGPEELLKSEQHGSMRTRSLIWCLLTWPSSQRHLVSLVTSVRYLSPPREGILVEFTAKWLGTQSLRSTSKRWIEVFNSQSEVWEGKSESQSVRRKVQRVTEGEK